MGIIFEYIRPVVFFLLLETVIFNLISDIAFKKLTKLFCGIILILLILIPLEKLLGMTELPEELLKNEQLQQSIRECENMINYGDSYLAEKYSEEYKKIIKEDIRQMVENEGLTLTNCEIDMETEENVKIKKIILSISEEGEDDRINIYRDISISVNGDAKQISEEPEIIKIKNQIIGSYQIEEGNILIRRVK
ncbi:MAG: stage III sporulation protein AF [Lachnospiraceae bacterium]|nr:stage III sporulation protein AF [Lachnospiraceae bacterium]MCI9369878.1 stage III sporulation protein AF [Lachnospiraceae bacterium]